MGFSYAGHAFVLIIADHSEGLTKQEILEINSKTYHSHLEEYFNMITNFDSVSSEGMFIEERNGKYHLKKDVDMRQLQKCCRFGAQIGFGFHNYKPKFWKGKLFEGEDVPGDD